MSDIAYLIVNLVSAFIVMQIIGFFLGVYFYQKMLSKFNARTRKDLALKFNLTEDHLKNEETDDNIINYLAEYYSNNLLVNRLSDFLKIVNDLIGLLMVLITLFIVAYVIYLIYLNGLREIDYIWLVNVVWLIGIIIQYTITILSKLFLGRYPGEASQHIAIMIPK